MKLAVFKKITLIVFVVILVGNTFATNAQTFSTDTERCEIENLHTSPCALVLVDGVSVQIEQDLDDGFSSIDIGIVDFEYVSLIKNNISVPRNNFLLYYARDFDPPSFTELPRSHISIG